MTSAAATQSLDPIEEQFTLYDTNGGQIARQIAKRATELCHEAGIHDGLLISAALQEAVAQQLKDNSPPCTLADRFRTAADNFHQAARDHVLSGPVDKMVSFEAAIAHLPALLPAGPWTAHATVVLEGIISGHSIHLVRKGQAIQWTAKRIMDPAPYGRGSAPTETAAFREAFSSYSAALHAERGHAEVN